MKLTKKEVQHIALLARIGLTDKEIETYGKQLSTILDYVSQLKELDTEGTLETAQVTGLENIMRTDAVEDCKEETREKIIENFPEKDDSLLKTKSVF